MSFLMFHPPFPFKLFSALVSSSGDPPAVGKSNFSRVCTPARVKPHESPHNLSSFGEPSSCSEYPISAVQRVEHARRVRFWEDLPKILEGLPNIVPPIMICVVGGESGWGGRPKLQDQGHILPKANACATPSPSSAKPSFSTIDDIASILALRWAGEARACTCTAISF